MRLEPYETMTVGLIQDGEGNEYDRAATFKAVKGQVEKWITEAANELQATIPSG